MPTPAAVKDRRLPVPALIITGSTPAFRLQARKLGGSEFTPLRVTPDEATHQLCSGPHNPLTPGPVLLLGPLGDARLRTDLHRLRRETSIPIVLLTDEINVQRTVEFLGLGANEVLHVGASAAELLATLRSRQRRVRRVVLDHGPLVLDVDRHHVTLGGQTLALSRQEMLLLNTLLRKPERLHTREALTRTLWPEEEHVRSNRLDVTLSTLRGKFRLAGIEQPFRHVRGLGVRLKNASELETDLNTG